MSLTQETRVRILPIGQRGQVPARMLAGRRAYQTEMSRQRPFPDKTTKLRIGHKNQSEHSLAVIPRRVRLRTADFDAL
jgi:hypothetical protein